MFEKAKNIIGKGSNALPDVSKVCRDGAIALTVLGAAMDGFGERIAEASDDSPKQSKIDWLPGYPVKGQSCLIINGDSNETKHLVNTEKTVDMCQRRGFEPIVVMQDRPVMNGKGVRQYPAKSGTLEVAFNDLGNSLERDDMVFLYVTGHGTPDNGGSFMLERPVGSEEFGGYVKDDIVRKGARIVGVFDGCFSGIFPADLIWDKRAEGIALSPGLQCFKTGCQFFTPVLMEALESEWGDINGDGVNQVSEAFITAMVFYGHATGLELWGTYESSIPELTSNNFKEVMAGSKPVIIEIGATWCGPCHKLQEELSVVNGLYGHRLKAVKITKDTNPESENLIRSLGFGSSNFGSIPVIAVKDKDGVRILQNGAPSTAAGLVQLFEEKLDMPVELSDAPHLYLEYYPVYAELAHSELLFRYYADILLGRDPESFIMFYENYKDAPDADDYLNRAVAMMVSREPIPVVALYRNYKHLKFGENMFKAALHFALKNDPEGLLHAYPQYKDESYAGEVKMQAEQAIRAKHN